MVPEGLESRFADLFGHAPTIIARAPGRVNIIGEHTDYNGGFVLPAAIDRNITIACSLRRDRQVRAYSINFERPVTFGLDAIEPAQNGLDRWSNYLRAMAHILKEEGVDVPGMCCAVLGTVPLGAGLSSSAALLVAAGVAFTAAARVDMDPVTLALLAQRAEREFVGVNVGIMDQLISALGQPRHALLIDTRSVQYRPVPVHEPDTALVIADTRKSRGLVHSEYNTRRSECDQAVAILRDCLPSITALRDVTLDELEAYSGRLTERLCRRARHVITENCRAVEAADAFDRGDLTLAGRLMNESHESLRLDYEVSCDELDALVDAARQVDGVYGSRMTGAGFGGCTVSLARAAAVDDFLQTVPGLYRRATGRETNVYVTTASGGAERLK